MLLYRANLGLILHVTNSLQVNTHPARVSFGWKTESQKHDAFEQATIVFERSYLYR